MVISQHLDLLFFAVSLEVVASDYDGGLKKKKKETKI